VSGYTIRFKQAALRELKTVSRQIHTRVIAAIEKLSLEPRPRGCRKIRGLSDTFRIRVGQYRVLYTVDDTERVVRITHIRHRREAYD
jgi:mRNA interferase RelE/StbE